MVQVYLNFEACVLDYCEEEDTAVVLLLRGRGKGFAGADVVFLESQEKAWR